METFSNISKQEIPWQASGPVVLMNILAEVLAAKEASDIIPQRSPRQLTKEAACMICVMLVFTLLAVLGSLLTAYESFFKDGGKKNKYLTISYEKNSVKSETKLEMGEKRVKSHAWLEDCKSFLKCFCLVRNGRKILNTVSPEEKMDCIEGLRFVGNVWVIYGHTGLFYFSFLRDIELSRPFHELRTSQLLWNSIFSVDIFFVISGFLNAYSFFHIYIRRSGNISWVSFYFKRFIRLTPVYMLVLGFFSTLFTYTGTGITWPTYDTNPVCRKDWWWYLLYINNFEESTHQCMGWCWYLAADMQLYIVSPLFFISLMRWPRFGYFLVFSCIAGSCAASFTLTYWFNLCDGLSRFEFYLADMRLLNIRFWKYFDIVYTKPYSRLSSYLVGLTLGYYLYSENIKKNVIRDSKIVLISGWIVTASLMWISFFSFYKREENILMDIALYNGTKSLFFSCGVAWIVYVCFTGQAEFLNSCLSWKSFLLLSRLSYCAYLIHMIVILRVFLQAEDAMDYSVMSLMSLYLYVCVFTYAAAFVVSILFEIPVLNLLERLSKKNKEKTSRTTNSVSRTNSQNESDIYKIS